MVISTSQNISNNPLDNTQPPEGYTYYPFPPGQCPPTYYVILQGVCAPLVIIISTVLNSLIGVVLLQKHLRSPTNILLLAIALYDTLTGLFPFPAYIYVFTFRRCDDYMPYNYGWFHRINFDVLPFIFHTCSIWVTVVLAIQRYIYVCHSEKAKQWCTVPMTLKAIAGVNLLALLVAVPMFVEGTFHPSTVQSLKNPNIIFNACVVRDYSEDPRYSTLYSIYSVLRALLINVGPCTILVILNAILVERMKEAKQNRERLIKKRQQDSRTQDQTSVTLMLVIVVTLFLIVEIPMAIHLIIFGLLKMLKSDFLAAFLSFSVQLLNFAVLLSYPINFFIYCRMSRAFRDAFTKLLCPSWNDSRQERMISSPTQCVTKPLTNNTNHNNNNNNNNNPNTYFDRNETQMEVKSAVCRTTLPSSTVILNSTTNNNENVISTATSPTPADLHHSTKTKTSNHFLNKQRVLFHDDIRISSSSSPSVSTAMIRSTDL